MTSIEEVMVWHGTQIVTLDEASDADACQRAFDTFLAGHKVVAVDTEGFREPCLVSLIQVASSSGVVVQTVDTTLPPLLKSLLEDTSVIKVFFSAADDLKRLRAGFGCMVESVVDLQALTVSEFDVRAHSLVDALNRLRVGGPHGLLTKDSFGKRGFHRYPPQELARVPGFVTYAASDAWATLCGFESWLALTSQQMRSQRNDWNARRSIYSAVTRIRDDRTRMRYEPLFATTKFTRSDIVRLCDPPAAL
jgi:hypothetical protein